MHGINSQVVFMTQDRRTPAKTAIANTQARDTGMALVLVLLLIWYLTRRAAFVLAAAVLHVVNMTAPQVYRPAAVVWFGLSNVLGLVVSRVVLAAVFFGVVTPVGLLRRAFGADVMQLKAFKSGRGSVMDRRDHVFTGQEMEHPY
jgi:hypothetical protein